MSVPTKGATVTGGQEITIEQFREMLRYVFKRLVRTDLVAELSPDGLLLGQCGIVSLVAQNLFGGELMRGFLVCKEFKYSCSHYWNILPNGEWIDFTDAHFQRRKPRPFVEIRHPKTITREYALRDPEIGDPQRITQRYKELMFHIVAELNQYNPLFDLFLGSSDSSVLYKHCFYTALDSPCKKLKVGCIAVKRNKWEGDDPDFYGYNNTIEELADLCEPECCRIGIPSRTKSMLGACAHAEEEVLWQIINSGHNPAAYNLYVTALKPSGMPSSSKAAIFSCLRCALQLHRAGIGGVYLLDIQNWKWMRFTTKEALQSAKQYAIDRKEI